MNYTRGYCADDQASKGKRTTLLSYVIGDKSAAEPSAAEPTAEEPLVTEPIVAEPFAAEPSAAAPVAGDSTAAEPDAPQLGAPGETHRGRGALKPAVAETAVAEPAIAALIEAGTIPPSDALAGGLGDSVGDPIAEEPTTEADVVIDLTEQYVSTTQQNKTMSVRVDGVEMVLVSKEEYQLSMKKPPQVSEDQKIINRTKAAANALGRKKEFQDFISGLEARKMDKHEIARVVKQWLAQLTVVFDNSLSITQANPLAPSNAPSEAATNDPGLAAVAPPVASGAAALPDAPATLDADPLAAQQGRRGQGRDEHPSAATGTAAVGKKHQRSSSTNPHSASASKSHKSESTKTNKAGTFYYLPVLFTVCLPFSILSLCRLGGFCLRWDSAGNKADPVTSAGASFPYQVAPNMRAGWSIWGLKTQVRITLAPLGEGGH